MGSVRHLGHLTAELVTAIDDAASRLTLLATRCYEDIPVRVSVSQLRALFALQARGPMNVTGLAEALGALPSSASRLCDRLAAAGLVDRVSNEASRREVLVTLTRDGERLLAELAARRRNDLTETLARMAPEARVQLLAGLQHFAAAHGAPNGDRTEPDGLSNVDHGRG